MNVLKKSCKLAIIEWCDRRKREVKQVRHIYPRAYVIGRAGDQCLVVARCWVDAEPQVVDQDKKNPLCTIDVFDDSLDAGMWCTVGYVCTAHGGEPVAIPVVRTEAE